MRHCWTSPGPAPSPSVGSGPNAVGVIPPPPPRPPVGGGAPMGGTVKVPPPPAASGRAPDGLVGVAEPPTAATFVFWPTSIDCAWHDGQIGMGSPGTGSVGFPQLTQIAVSSFARA